MLLCLLMDFCHLLIILKKLSKYGVTHVVNPGGSNGDEGVTSACDKYNMVMFHTGKRLFFH